MLFECKVCYVTKCDSITCRECRKKLCTQCLDCLPRKTCPFCREPYYTRLSVPRRVSLLEDDQWWTLPTVMPPLEEVWVRPAYLPQMTDDHEDWMSSSYDDEHGIDIGDYQEYSRLDRFEFATS